MPRTSAGPIRRSLSLPAVVLTLLAALAACSKSGGGTTDPSCKPLTAACSAPSDCCSGTCTAGVCADAVQCAPLASACNAAADCCSGACSSNVCVAPQGQCKALDAACTSASECCTGACTAQKCAVPTTCGELADPCAANEACCSGRCDGTKCVSADYCKPVDAECAPTRPSDCCTLSCNADATSSLGGRCSVSACKTASTQCSTDSDCCSGICAAGATASGSCQPVPASAYGDCTTLGETCATGTDCCSSNCKGGVCVQAYACEAYGDICYDDKSCCSGQCDLSTGAPGRCIDPPGGCVQGGNPCDNASNCCSRICKDMGTGVTVCAPAGGCRMTGEYCDSTAACCGGSGSATGTMYTNVACTSDDRCNGGTGCNPPGNICGVVTTVNAPQDCCEGKKAVCKPDSNGVYRCYGGGSTTCPTGYDASNPNCCLATGKICQFKDQCCDGEPCVPDQSGVLRCTAGAACKPTGSTCAGSTDTTCCDGPCTNIVEQGWKCQSKPPPSSCHANGDACTSSGDCCSGTCDAGTCRAPCLGMEGACTTTADCCSGFTCLIPPGSTSGTCESAGPAPSCAQTGGACSATTPCCDSAESCVNGTCAAASTCGGTSHACAADGDCCSGLLCLSTADVGGTLKYTACPSTPGAICSCDTPPPAYCVDPGLACSPNQPCCTGYCASTTTRAVCDGTTPCTCYTAG